MTTGICMRYMCLAYTARNQRRPPPSDRRTSSRRPPQRRWRKHIDGAAAAGRLSREQGSCREKHCIFVSFYSVGAGTSFEHPRTRLDETDSTQVESRPNSHGAKTYAVLKFLMGRLSCRGFCHWASVARVSREQNGGVATAAPPLGAATAAAGFSNCRGSV